MSQLRTVRLYGKLGARFGRVHRFHLESNTVAEAIRALDSQLAGFRAFMVNAKQYGMVFAVFAGKRNLVADELRDPVGSEDIRIAPVIDGSKSGGVLQTILGIVLIVVGVYTDNPNLIYSGALMVAGGVIQMLSPQPRSKPNAGANDPSYVFNGAVNTEAQGHPVPLLYGRMMVGSAVISAGIEAADYAPATTGIGPGSPNWKPNNPYEVAP
ncbi:MAG: tail assembly protein [Acidobacteriota bacterium]|nr:tail assembly protein [Xanthomonadaceae bacterium]MDE3188905.1 tail assembly protein [Acidobacteriota bacterium]